MKSNLLGRTTNCACARVTPPTSAANPEVKRCWGQKNRWPRAPKLSFTLSQVAVLLCSIRCVSPFPTKSMERVSLLAVAVNMLLALMANRVDGSLEGMRAINRVQVGLMLFLSFLLLMQYSIFKTNTQRLRCAARVIWEKVIVPVVIIKSVLPLSLSSEVSVHQAIFGVGILRFRKLKGRHRSRMRGGAT